MKIGNQYATTGSKIKARSGAEFTIKSIEEFYVIATDKSGTETILTFEAIIKFRVI